MAKTKPMKLDLAPLDGLSPTRKAKRLLDRLVNRKSGAIVFHCDGSKKANRTLNYVARFCAANGGYRLHSINAHGHMCRDLSTPTLAGLGESPQPLTVLVTTDTTG